jgi:hypothetical protein
MIENSQSLSLVTRKFKIQSPTLWQMKMFLMTMHNGGRVVKIDVMFPFCVMCHVGVHPDMFVTSIRTNIRKSLVTFELPLLQLVTKNGF